MRKSSVYLPDALKRQLTNAARRTHRSEADLIRAAVEQLVTGEMVTPEPPPEPPVPGRFVGIGVGPGAADLLTVRGLRALRRADVVIAPCTDATAPGRAEAIVREAAPDVLVERVVFAMTTEQSARSAALDAAAATVVERLERGAEVAFVTLGDPSLYSTFSSLAAVVSARRPGTIVNTVPGIMAFQELAARSGTVLADDRQTFLVLPAHRAEMVSDDGELASALRDPNRTVVVYKGGRNVTAVGERLETAGRLDGAVLGELLGLPGERVARLDQVVDQPATYLSTVIVPASPPS